MTSSYKLRLLWHAGTLAVLLGFALFFGGFLTVILPIAYWWNGTGVIQSYAEVGGLQPQVIAILAVAAGYNVVRRGATLRHRARKALAPDAYDVMSRDARPPILYLRSFDDDEQAENTPSSVVQSNPVAAVASSVAILLLNAVEGAHSSQEELLTRAMRKHGPFIAIGDPREDLPDLGAARLYVPDQEWRATVQALMLRAQFVVIRPGLSENLRWEIDQAVASVSPERLVFWLPEYPRDPARGEATYEYLRRKLQSYTSTPLPRWNKKRPCLCFGPHWTTVSFKKPKDVL